MAKVVVNQERCKGCELCRQACPKDVIALASQLNAKGFAPAEVVKPEACIACGFCGKMCPDAAIEVYRD